jgi:hypothetical protein
MVNIQSINASSFEFEHRLVCSRDGEAALGLHEPFLYCKPFTSLQTVTRSRKGRNPYSLG